MNNPDFKLEGARRIWSQLENLAWLKIGKEGDILFANKGFYQLLGYTPGSLKEENFASLFCSEERQKELPEAQSILAANETEYLALAHWRHAQGHTITVELLYKKAEATPSAKHQGHKAFDCELLVIARPAFWISELEKVIKCYREKMENVSKDRRKILHSLYQQMRSPLADMSLSVNMLRDYAERMSVSERLEEIHQIEEGIVSCQKILEKALQDTRGSNGKSSPMLDAQEE